MHTASRINSNLLGDTGGHASIITHGGRCRELDVLTSTDSECTVDGDVTETDEHEYTPTQGQWIHAPGGAEQVNICSRPGDQPTPTIHTLTVHTSTLGAVHYVFSTVGVSLYASPPPTFAPYYTSAHHVPGWSDHLAYDHWLHLVQ